MAGINKVILVGNLGKDPEVRAFENGAKVAQFSLATSESYKDKDGNWQEQTEWHNIVMWRQLAERAERDLKKGMQIFVEGKIKTRQWTDQNNATRYTTDILVDRFIMLGKRSENSNMPPIPTENDYQQHAAPPKTEGDLNPTPQPQVEQMEDDLPF
ncbi:MAG: single-stranded DNA-binding protein [Bacteroidales bacterium]|nr:single-stranded DNA-binding protein [Bacteroidales bacterium]